MKKYFAWRFSLLKAEKVGWLKQRKAGFEELQNNTMTMYIGTFSRRNLFSSTYYDWKYINLYLWKFELWKDYFQHAKRKKRTFDFNRNFYNKKHHGEDERLNFQISISKSHENDNNLNISFSTAMSMWYDHAKVLRSLIQKELIYTTRYRKNHRWHIWISCTCFAGSLLLRIFLVNMTKSAGNCGFGHTYWRNS